MALIRQDEAAVFLLAQQIITKAMLFKFVTWYGAFSVYQVAANPFWLVKP